MKVVKIIDLNNFINDISFNIGYGGLAIFEDNLFGEEV